MSQLLLNRNCVCQVAPINCDLFGLAERVRLMIGRLIGNYLAGEFHHYWTGYIRTQQPQATSSHFEGHTMYSCEVKSCWRFVGQAQVENTSCNGYKDRFHLCSTLPISCSLAPLPETRSTELHLRMLNFKWKLLRCHEIPWGTWLGRSMLHSHVLPQPPF